MNPAQKFGPMFTPSVVFGRQLVNPMFAPQAYLFVGSIVVSARLKDTRSSVMVAARANFFMGWEHLRSGSGIVACARGACGIDVCATVVVLVIVGRATKG